MLTNCEHCDEKQKFDDLDRKSMIENLIQQRNHYANLVASGDVNAKLSLQFINNYLSQFTNIESNTKCNGCGE